MMQQRALVLGAGIVGVCTAIHLRHRGFEVFLVDHRQPGQETSYGNAGLIQREAVEPYAFPLAAGPLLRIALMRDPKVCYDLRYLFRAAGALDLYRRCSQPARYAPIVNAYAHLIAMSTAEHAPLIEASGAGDLVSKAGWMRMFRSPREFERAANAATRLATDFGVDADVLDGPALGEAEPALQRRLAGGLHYGSSWAVRDPADLVARYARLFEQLGGVILTGDAASLCRQQDEWRLQTRSGDIAAGIVVLALGPWSAHHVRALGYAFPLFVKRGYHRHYRCEIMPRTPLLDMENGVMLAPMRAGLRITTGAEFAAVDAPPNPRQIVHARAVAAELVRLGEPTEVAAWMGARPCSADMLPIVGPAPRHPGMWFNFAHGHQGLTLAPVTGRLIAELISGEPPIVPPAPYAPDRFGGGAAAAA